MKVFQPTPDQVLKSYYEVPVDVLEDSDALCQWAEQSVAAQLRSGGPKHQRRRRKQ